MIYFARGLTSHLWKVGFTARRVDVRVKLLACTVKESIEVVAVIPGGLGSEAKYHRALDASRASGSYRGREWYRDDGAVAAIVAALPETARGSWVAAYSGRPRHTRRAPEVIAAEHAERRRAFLVEHGHESHVMSQTCALCAARRERFRRMTEKGSLRRSREEFPAFLRTEAA